MDSILDFGFSHSGIGVAQKALKNCLRINHRTYNNIVGCGICAKSTLSMKLIWDISTSFSLKILNWTKEYLVEYSFEWKVQCTYLCSMYYWGRYPAWNGKIDSKNGMGFWDMVFIWQLESGVAEVLVPVWGGVIGKIKKRYENMIYHIILWILTSALDFLSCQMELQLVWILSRLNWSI